MVFKIEVCVLIVFYEDFFWEKFLGKVYYLKLESIGKGWNRMRLSFFKVDSLDRGISDI